MRSISRIGLKKPKRKGRENEITGTYIRHYFDFP